MRDKIIANIKKYNLINKGDSILVGFSGGIDSSALLYSLLSIREDFDLTISICHLHHGVRGCEADRDEEFAKKTAQRLGLYFESERVDMHGQAKREKISKEAAGRKLRQVFFEKVSKKIGADKIALAHNYNDQVETLIMRIIRGTGIDGLNGIDYKTNNIIRPLLNITREEIENYIKENNIDYVEDSTNLEVEYHRNKIRNILLPVLRKEYNPNIDTSIFNLSELAKLDVNFLEEYTEEIFNKIAVVESNRVSIGIESLKRCHKAIQNRIIRRIFLEFPGGLTDLSKENVAEVLRLADLDSGKIIDNLNGLQIRNSYGKLIFRKHEKIDDTNFYIPLQLGTNIVHGMIIQVSESNDCLWDKNLVSLPKDLVKGELVARNRMNGDRIMPLGMSGTKKVKDIFIDNKVDRELRYSYIVISDSEKIYWIIDLVKSELTKEKSKTNEYINIKIMEE